MGLRCAGSCVQAVVMFVLGAVGVGAVGPARAAPVEATSQPTAPVEAAASQRVAPVEAAVSQRVAPVEAAASQQAASARAPACPRAPQRRRQLSGWNLEFSPYLWLAGFRGEVGVRIGDEVLAEPLDVSFDELSKNLKIGAMGSVRFRYRRFAVFGEANYISFGSQHTIREVNDSRLNTALRMVFGTAYLSYGFEPWPGMTLNPYLGSRWWWLEPALAFVGGALDGTDWKAARAWADPLAGLFVRNDINDRWFVELTGDVGGGMSIISWQLHGALGYNFARWLGAFASYRFVGVNYDRDHFVYRLTIQGLLLGLRFTI